MIKVSRLGHLTLETPDIERQLDYYHRVMGLQVIARDDRRVFLGTRVGELAVVLQVGALPRCTQLAFELPPTADLAAIGRFLAAEGINAELRSDAQLGSPSLLAFTDPDGREVALFSERQFFFYTN